MVRHYKKKTEKTYTVAELQQALKDVNNKNMTSYQAAEKYGIPRSTIISRVYHTDMSDKIERPTVFSEETEKRMANSLHIMEKHGFPLTRKEVAVLVSQFVRRNGINTPFKNDMPGKDWLQAFQKRHSLSIKKPQSVEIARRMACDPYIIYGYFNLLSEVLACLGLEDKPQQIYNLDETSICNDPVKGKVIGKQGFRCTRTTSGPGRNNTTVLLAANASGKKVPPLIIFQGKHLWTEWLYKNEMIDTAYAVSDKGWMQTSIFEKYIKSVFVPALGSARPVLLIYDGHSTHVDLNVIEYAQSEGVTILKLPPHSSHVLQPLDCSAMKPLKDRWEDEVIKWQRLHIGTNLPKSEFARILTKIWDELDPLILQNGFRKTGIQPLNRNAIKEEIFDPLVLQKWKNSQADAIQESPIPAVQVVHGCGCNITHELENSQSNAIQADSLPAQDKHGSDCNETQELENSQSKAIQADSLPAQDKHGSDCNETQELENSQSNAIQADSLPAQDKHACYNCNETQEFKENVMPVVPSVPSLTTIALTKINKQFTNGQIVEKICDEPSSSFFSNNNSHQKKAYQSNIKMQNVPITVTSKLPISKKFDLNKLSSLKILDCKLVKNAAKTNELKEPCVSFEELLLQTISKSDLPKTKKKRIANSNAEVLTYKDTIDRMKKEKEEKEMILKDKENKKKEKEKKKKDKENQKKQKLLEKQAISKSKKPRKPKKQERESGGLDPKSKYIKKSGKRNIRKCQKYVSDSDSPCSYVSLSETESVDNLETFYNRMMELDYEENVADVELVEASTSKIIPVQCWSKQKPKEGKFILAKFSSSKGKKTFKYVCQIESVSEGKIVVQGFHSLNKNKKVFRIIENDHSIIEEHEIIDYLPDPDVKGVDYMFPNDIDIKEYT